MNKLILILLVLILAIGSTSVVNQLRADKGVSKTCIFGSPCCKKESDIDWSTGFAKK